MRRTSPILLLPLLAALLLVGGCASSRILGGDAAAVWIRSPLLGWDDSDEVAAAYCGRFGKRAVYDVSLKIGDSTGLNPTKVYKCR